MTLYEYTKILTCSSISIIINVHRGKLKQDGPCLIIGTVPFGPQIFKHLFLCPARYELDSIGILYLDRICSFHKNDVLIRGYFR